MRKGAYYAVLAILGAAVLLVLVLTHSGPLLYAIEKDVFPSRFHENAEALRQQSLNSTLDIAPDLQEFIDFTGPISLNIRIRNIDQARREFERFGKSHGSIKNLVIKLDMSESEIQELERDTALQKQILESLFNTSISLEALQSLEVQYHEQNNEDMLTTIRLQGNELRSKVKGLGGKYRDATSRVVTNAKKLGLDTTKTEQSQKYVDEIIKNIEQPSPVSQIYVDTSLIPGEERLSLFIRPDIGRYRDVIEYQGISLTLQGNATIRAVGTPITIYQGDLPLASATTDKYGYYNVKVPIERADIGPNIIYAKSSSTRSVNRTLTAIPLNTTTTLVVSEPDSSGSIVCNGSVIANVPVRSASVQITWDNSNTLVTRTDQNGRFTKTITLPPGEHTLIAMFTGTGYPLYPSESDPVTVDIPLVPGVKTKIDWRFITMIMIGIIVACIFVGAGYLYYKRITKTKRIHLLDLVKKYVPGTGRNSSDISVKEDDLASEEVPVQEQVPENSQHEGESLLMYYTRILSEQGLSAASRLAYTQIAARVARDLRIRKHYALTAREMARTCKGRPYCGTFARFTAAYERVRYGGAGSVKDQKVFESAMEMADDQTGGDDH